MQNVDSSLWCFVLDTGQRYKLEKREHKQYEKKLFETCVSVMESCREGPVSRWRVLFCGLGGRWCEVQRMWFAVRMGLLCSRARGDGLIYKWSFDPLRTVNRVGEGRQANRSSSFPFIDLSTKQGCCISEIKTPQFTEQSGAAWEDVAVASQE